MRRGTNWKFFSNKYNGAKSLIWVISSESDYFADSFSERLDSNTFIDFFDNAWTLDQFKLPKLRNKSDNSAQ